MMTEKIPPAPDLTEGHRQGKEGYPSRGKKLGPAWRWCWEQLHRAPGEGWLDGRDLATEAAKQFELKDVSVAQLLTRMATADEIPIERGHRAVYIPRRGNRTHTFYRIKRS